MTTTTAQEYSFCNQIPSKCIILKSITFDFQIISIIIQIETKLIQKQDQPFLPFRILIDF